MKIMVCLMLLGVSACSWQFAPDERGRTRFRQKYPTGMGIYYTNGAASQNTHYHMLRPEQHVILP